MKTVFVAATLLAVGLTMPVKCQESYPELDAYLQFLEQNKNMDAADLVNKYPAGFFKDAVTPFSLDQVNGYPLLDEFYQFGYEEEKMIRKNGFVVIEDTQEDLKILDQFITLYNNDLPVFISADAILHAFHESYDDILIDVEEGFLIDQLGRILIRMHEGLAGLDVAYGSDPLLRSALKDLDLYLTIPIKLLRGQCTPYYYSNRSRLSRWLQWIDAEEEEQVRFFTDSEDCSRWFDFSQFTPRGHYTRSEELSAYFRAMIWLGRTEIYLTEPSSGVCKSGFEEESFLTIQRQIMAAALIREMFSDDALMKEYRDFEQIISAFVGKQDNVTLPDLMELFEESGIASPAGLVHREKVEHFQEVLLTKPYSGQAILSQMLSGGGSGAVEPASAFLLFGQRFVIDSYVTGQVVYDQIQYQNREPCRLYPKTLDILFALGNDASTHLLLDDLERYHYGTNLAGLRYLIGQFPPEFWNSTLYNGWLNAIKTLNPSPDRESLPEFMQTGAWGLRTMNTQLASWTELRHDNLLYVKQSYTSGGLCEFPAGYVEPVPGFFRAISDLCRQAVTTFSYLESHLSGMEVYPPPETVREFFVHFGSVCDTLQSIAAKEVAMEALDPTDMAFINSMVGGYELCGSGGKRPSGWYTDLFYWQFKGMNADPRKTEVVVADYHTTPTDCLGTMIGDVSHAGTGLPEILVLVAGMPDGSRQAFAGPVMSYREYVTHDFDRLTDQEWEASYLGSSQRPEWVYNYMVPLSGSVETDLKLFSSREELNSRLGTVDVPGSPVKESDKQLRVYPNPVGSTMIISLKIPHRQGTTPVNLSLFNAGGSLVETVWDEPLAPGNHLIRWERKLLEPGVYFLRSIGEELTETVPVILAD